VLTEDDLTRLVAPEVSDREQSHASGKLTLAIDVAEHLITLHQIGQSLQKTERNVEGADFERLLKWKAQLQNDVARQNIVLVEKPRLLTDALSSKCLSSPTSIGVIRSDNKQQYTGAKAGAFLLEPEVKMSSLEPNMLKERQCWA
jgi:hypothetical protein